MGDLFGNSSGGNSGGQTTLLVVVALCCCSSLLVALFLWYAYNNQSKFTWLNWFYKLFGSTPADTPAASDTTGGTSAPASTSTPVDTPVDTSTPKTPKTPALPKCSTLTGTAKTKFDKDLKKAQNKDAADKKNHKTTTNNVDNFYKEMKKKTCEKYAPLPENEFW